MNEKVAVATVQGKAYFLIVNQLREQNIPFISLVPGQSVPSKMIAVITTEQEKHLVNHEKILVFKGENELERLADKVKIMLSGKEAFEKNRQFTYDPSEIDVMLLSHAHSPLGGRVTGKR